MAERFELLPENERPKVFLIETSAGAGLKVGDVFKIPDGLFKITAGYDGSWRCCRVSDHPNPIPLKDYFIRYA